MELDSTVGICTNFDSIDILKKLILALPARDLEQLSQITTISRASENSV